MNKKEEVNAINIQLFGLALYFVSFFLSFLTTYNQKLNLEKRKKIFSPQKALTITYINRILVIFLSFLFLYVNYKLFNLSKKENENLKSYILQIIASYLVIISSFITFYVVTLSTTETTSDIENPIV